MGKIDDLFEKIGEKCLKIFDKFLDKVDKKMDDDEWVDKLGKYIKVNIDGKEMDLKERIKKENK